VKVIPNNRTTKVEWCLSIKISKGRHLTKLLPGFLPAKQRIPGRRASDCRDANQCCSEESVGLGRHTKRTNMYMWNTNQKQIVMLNYSPKYLFSLLA